MSQHSKRRKWTNPLQDINPHNPVSGFAAALMAMTGPPAILLEAAKNGNFTTEQTICWVFSISVLGGIFGIIMSLSCRQPITGAHSITAIAFLATVTAQFSYNELIGAYVLSGLLIFLIGITGIFSKLLNLVPEEILAAMLAGMIAKYIVDFILSITELFVIGAGSLIVYLFFSRGTQKINPMVAAILTAAILLIATHPVGGVENTSSFILPRFRVPEFSLPVFVSVSIPVSLLILSNDAAVGLGALQQNDFKPPVSRIIAISGVFSMLAGVLGGQSANIAGMMTAVCSGEEAGPREKRYLGSVISGVLLILYGLFAWVLIPWFQALPHAFITMLIGYSLIGVFCSSLQQSFSQRKIKLGTGCAFAIAMSNIMVFNISAPVWSVLIGTLIVRYVEKSRTTLPDDGQESVNSEDGESVKHESDKKESDRRD